MPPEVCPNCGADVPPKAKACPECGSDEKTGWSDEGYDTNLGIPDNKFDYGEFIKEEFGMGTGSIKPRNTKWIWWVTAVGLILLFAFFFFHR